MGVGAAAAVVAEWPPERVAIGAGGLAGSGTLEDDAPETTSKAEASEGAATETTDEDDPDGVGSSGANFDETAFVHTVTDGNSRGDYTYIGDPSIDGDPDAVVLVAPTPDQASASASASAGAGAYVHNIGVWYDFVDKNKWAIFNQDRAAVPVGATFEVVVPPASESFTHRAEIGNTAGDATYLDDPLTNGRPDAVVSVTQNWNPGGGVGVYNDHPVSVFYDEYAEQWAVYNLDGAPIPDGTAFNVAVSESA